ncbi:MAG: hypothetical protein ACRDA5_16495, partial [Clostridium sp.]
MKVKKIYKLIVITIVIIVAFISIVIVSNRMKDEKEIININTLINNTKYSMQLNNIELISEAVPKLKLLFEEKKANNINKVVGIGNTKASKDSSQLVTVVSKGGSNAELTLWERDKDNNWNSTTRTFARLGSGGMKEAGEVYEMDLCTP